MVRCCLKLLKIQNTDNTEQNRTWIHAKQNAVVKYVVSCQIMETINLYIEKDRG